MMDRKLVGAVLLLLASNGCRTCQTCYDYAPPVLDGPHPYTGARAGSAFGPSANRNVSYEGDVFYEGEETGPPLEADSDQAELLGDLPDSSTEDY